MTVFQQTGAPVGRIGRALLCVWSVLLICGFVVARWLEPDPRGFGTHQQLGLPECTIRTLFARPCPGCGMTTCFSYFVRGDFASAARANPAGVLLAMLCVLMIPWSITSAVNGRFWMVEEPLTSLAVVIAAIGVVASLAWLVAFMRHA